MSELRKYIIQSFCEDPLETSDVLAQALRELNIYITHDDNEELGRHARLGVWQKVFVFHMYIWRWVMFLADPVLLYWQGNGKDDEYSRNSSTINNGVDDDSDNPSSPHPHDVGSNRS
ncbi:hypothetical protein BDC45DRAFT_565475 [Circinella umbellata]|nr:hypothetical protein BDC45DRAFT_565475 [Circinella umbellata]